MIEKQSYYIKKIIESWAINEYSEMTSFEDIIAWISDLNKKTLVKVQPTEVNKESFWFYDDYNGEILNVKRSFFSIKGVRYFDGSNLIKEQPLICQPEIGYLGIICKEINGVLYFLMQAKIEPGNVNCIQISPTIQATKSNFTRMHGGKMPAYFDFFDNHSDYYTLYDQLQSEQGERFYKKRNRNIIIVVDKEIEILPNFKWMTLGQIKHLMQLDNIVNMDTRTVISGIPFSASRMDEKDLLSIREFFSDRPLFYSMFDGDNIYYTQLVSLLNDFKMNNCFDCRFVPLNQLIDWEISDSGVFCKKEYDYSIQYYDIEIAGREVRKWSQPLLKAFGAATIVLLTKIINNRRLFLVRIVPEIGSFDVAEVGPSAHWEASKKRNEYNAVDQFIFEELDCGKRLIDVVLSEEGGRFFHEQNRNIVIEIDREALKSLPREYMWVDYSCLNLMIQSNNFINIQLRNLLSLLNL